MQFLFHGEDQQNISDYNVSTCLFVINNIYPLFSLYIPDCRESTTEHSQMNDLKQNRVRFQNNKITGVRRCNQGRFKKKREEEEEEEGKKKNCKTVKLVFANVQSYSRGKKKKKSTLVWTL